MSDLIVEYFKRDLTEAEERELAGRLSTSPEEALRFAGLMDGHYRGLGLPEPAWPGRPLPRSGDGFWGRILPPAILLLLLLLGFGYILWRANIQALKGETEMASPRAPEVPAARHQSRRRMRGLPPRPSPTPTAAPLRERPRPAPARLRPARALPPAPPLPVLSPPRPAVPAMPPARTWPARGRVYEELSVHVDLTETGLVTVKVLDASRKPVRVIFAGLLPPGQRTFTWDGKTGAGSLAPAGLYTLQVQSGSSVLRRTVRLEAGGPD